MRNVKFLMTGKKCYNQINIPGGSQTFQNEEAARGLRGEQGGLTGTQNGSTPYTSVQSEISFGGKEGQSFCRGGPSPSPLSGYATEIP